jgi:vacuolar-type H+-ATPase subunit E/Vma4
MNKEKVIHLLFIGKVAEEIGIEKASNLLKEAKDTIDEILEDKDKNQSTIQEGDLTCMSTVDHDLRNCKIDELKEENERLNAYVKLLKKSRSEAYVQLSEYKEKMNFAWDKMDALVEKYTKKKKISFRTFFNY